MPRFAAYGLVIEAPFDCGWLAESAASGEPDIVVVRGPVSPRLEGADETGGGWQDDGRGRHLVRCGPRAGRFLAESGTRVTHHLPATADDAHVAVAFVGRVLPVLLRQRGLLVLHANAVEVEGRAIVLAGESGSGKSTTTAALTGRGARLLSDDVTAIRLDAEGRPEAVVGATHLHLTEEAAGGLGWDLTGVPRQPWRRMKAALEPASGWAGGPATVQTVAMLAIADRPDDTDVRREPLSPEQSFAALQGVVYGPYSAREAAAVFPILAAVAQHTQVWRVTRPMSRWTADDVVEALL